ncbi:hypothetical protein CERSUDRAFT_99920 [Gelatoporia subvermispora B]|uniref:Uncharacterized protein n=1 Tax=Ceriporiopsis subvermispora (strain B) TaxID=914234 RepID=M2Q575_CERS8|nr:hypothetical protein CERSUDRAFT_99920 [Gelatoporia subvermispora B]
MSAILKVPFRKTATPQARRIVLDVLAAQQKPLTIQELWNCVVQHESQTQGNSPPAVAAFGPSAGSGEQITAPYSHHIIPSMRFLKQEVVPSLRASAHIEQIHRRETLTPDEQARRLGMLSKASQKSKAAQLAAAVSVWRWQLREKRPDDSVPEEKTRFGEEVGVGADWSHLNRRRQNSRVDKVKRDVRWLKELDKARQEGADAAQSS